MWSMWRILQWQDMFWKNSLTAFFFFLKAKARRVEGRELNMLTQVTEKLR